MIFNGSEASSDAGVASLFNDFFHSTFTIGDQSSLITVTTNSHGDTKSITEIHFTTDNVYESLANLDVSEAMGLDRIPNYVLKYCAESLCEPLCYLFLNV